MKKFYIHGYNPWRDSFDPEFGFFINGSHIIASSLFDKDDSISCLVKLFVTTEPAVYKNTRKEYFVFEATFNPQKFKKLDEFGLYFDLDKLASEYAPEKLRNACDRLERFNAMEPREPVIYTGQYGYGSEFLEFTKETASSWAGPFEKNGMLGCLMNLSELENQLSSMSVINVQADWKYWHIPQSYCEANPELKDRKIYRMSPEDKEALFYTFPLETQFKITQKLLETELTHLSSKLPFHLRLNGNDDTSYTKYFASQVDAEKELKYLRSMQPLDFNKDIVERGYEFTN